MSLLNENHIFGVNPNKKPPLNNNKNKSFSPLPWTSYFDEKKTISFEENNGSFNYYQASSHIKDTPVFFFIHGAGFTGLSFALITARLKQKYHCIAVDLRGHGETDVTPSRDFSLKTLSNDVSFVLNKLIDQKRSVIIVGHSLGGAVSVRVAKENKNQNIAAVIVIDLSEGTAINALPLMTEILQRIPTSFDSEEEAISWSAKNSNSRSVEACRVTIPSRLYRAENVFSWRTNLFSTRDFWQGWFKGMSADFVELPVARLLILADTNRLDKTMTIAQMQGRFQLEVLPGSGHEVHENNADGVAEVLDRFVERNKFFRGDIF